MKTIINGKLKRSLLETRSYRGADVNSDHHLVIPKLKKAGKNNTSYRKIIDIKRLTKLIVKLKF